MNLNHGPYKEIFEYNLGNLTTTEFIISKKKKEEKKIYTPVGRRRSVSFKNRSVS